MVKVKILYEDEDLIVCVKPSGMPSQGERSSSMDLVSWIKNYLVTEQRKKGIVVKQPPYVAVVHRLDQPVSGIMVYAKSKKAAAELSRQFSQQDTHKYYLAVLTGILPQDEGELRDLLERNGKTNTSYVVEQGGKKAVLKYRKIETKNERTLVEIELFTGRHHQIRVQTAHAGYGIYGDMKYNAQKTQAWRDAFAPCERKPKLCLFSWKLAFTHPVSGERMSFKIMPDKALMAIDEWQSLPYYE